MKTKPKISIADIETFADDPDLERMVGIYNEHGCLIVRGLMSLYVNDLHRDIGTIAQESIVQLDEAVEIVEGWRTPNGTLFIPTPEGSPRDKQIMVLGIHYNNSEAFEASSRDPKVIEIVTAVLGSNFEIFGSGQSLYKEANGGHPKLLHQDSAYFQHRHEGPVGILSYVVDTDLINGALYVVPGSHKLGQLRHIDTFSHLGLDPEEWTWEDALPIIGKAGDSRFFHVQTIHGSKQNFSDKPRPIFINRYRRKGDETIISGTTIANRTESELLHAESQQ